MTMRVALRQAVIICNAFLIAVAPSISSQPQAHVIQYCVYCCHCCGPTKFPMLLQDSLSLKHMVCTINICSVAGRTRSIAKVIIVVVAPLGRRNTKDSERIHFTSDTPKYELAWSMDLFVKQLHSMYGSGRGKRLDEPVALLIIACRFPAPRGHQIR